MEPSAQTSGDPIWVLAQAHSEFRVPPLPLARLAPRMGPRLVDAQHHLQLMLFPLLDSVASFSTISTCFHQHILTSYLIFSLLMISPIFGRWLIQIPTRSADIC